MLILTIFALLIFMSHTGNALALAQHVTTTSTSTPTVPIFTYLTQSPDVRFTTIPPATLTTLTPPLPTNTKVEHHTLSLTPTPTPPPTPTTDDSTEKPPTTTHTEEVPNPTPTYASWVLPATASLLAYDFLAMVAFAWCWVMGWLWWWRKIDGRGRDVQRLGESEMEELRERERVRIVNEGVEREMRALGIV